MSIGSERKLPSRRFMTAKVRVFPEAREA
jgi:hypothetical protein